MRENLLSSMAIDVLILAAFVLYSIYNGFRNRRLASRSLEDYFLAGRTLSGWKAGLSMAATQYAADTPLLVTGLFATAGIFSLWRLWIYGIAFLTMGFLLAASWRRARVLTDAELTELRYGGPLSSLLRGIKAIHLGTMVNCTVLAMVLIAAARIAEPFLLWHDWLPEAIYNPMRHLVQQLNFQLTTSPADPTDLWTYSTNNFISILWIVAFTWLYSTTGGLRSVVATDVVQFSIMIVGTLFYAVYVCVKVGGIGALSTQLQALYGTPAAEELLSFGPSRWNDAMILFLALLAVQWFAQVNSDGTGYLAQRSMACRSDRDARIAAVTFTFSQIVLRSLLWLPIIVGLLILYPVEHLPELGTASEAFRIEREASFAWGIRDLLPIGIRGLMLTAMLAALASTVDTHLNWGASYWTNDLYKRYLMEGWLQRTPSPKELVWVARLSNLGILILALLIGAHLSSIQGAWHLSLLFGSGLGVVLILRWIWYRINIYSELTAGVVSLAFAPILLFLFPDWDEGERLLSMVVISTTMVIGVTLLTPPESESTLQRFYTTTQPVGFWGPTARQLGDDPMKSRRLFYRAIAAILSSAGSVFLLLVGIGRLLIGNGEGTIGSILLIGVGLALIPLWIRWGIQSPTAIRSDSSERGGPNRETKRNRRCR